MGFKYNINSTLRVAKIELNSMIYSPVVWLVLLVIILQVSSQYFIIFEDSIRSQQLYGGSASLAVKLFTTKTGGCLPPVLKNLHLYLPLITMGLMSREYQSGSIKLLFSSPINNASIILGKFVTMMIYGASLMLYIIALALFTGIFVENLDYSAIWTAVLGMYFLILAYSAVGIFMSSLTPYQVVAAIGTIAILAGFNELQELGANSDFFREITYWAGIRGRSDSFISGLISTEDVLYFFIIITLFLSLAIFKLNTEKISMSKTKKIIGYFAIFFGALFLGYITTFPTLKFYYDATFTESNTISDESKSILAKVKEQKGDVTIVDYNNVLSELFYIGRKSSRMFDQKKYIQIRRYMPEMKFEYINYYNKKTNDPLMFVRQNMDKDEEELAMSLCENKQFKWEDLLSYQEFKEKYIDLESEGFRHIRAIETADGSREFIRTFSEGNREPGEREFFAAFSRLINGAVNVGFYSNNTNRSINNYGDKGLMFTANSKWSRMSLINQGFDTKEVNLEIDNIDELDILVIADLDCSLSSAELAKIKSYIDKGGNLYIASDFQRSENMNSILSLIGVKSSEGILAQDRGFNSSVILPLNITEKGVGEQFFYQLDVRMGRTMAANNAVAIDYSKSKDFGFDSFTTLETPADTWIEYETTDLIDGEFICNETANEAKGIYSVLVNLSREVNGKEQRIIVSGDADIFANIGLSTKYSGINSNNSNSMLASFRWLSNEQCPVDIRDLDAEDTYIDMSRTILKIFKIFASYLIPIALIIFSIFLIIKRQRK